MSHGHTSVSDGVGDECVECPKEASPPHLCCPAQHLQTVVEVEVCLPCHLHLNKKELSSGKDIWTGVDLQLQSACDSPPSLSEHLSDVREMSRNYTDCWNTPRLNPDLSDIILRIQMRYSMIDMSQKYWNMPSVM